MRYITAILAVLVLITPGYAQNNQSDILAWAPARSIGVYVYPMHNQSPNQEFSDQTACYQSAMQQTGFNPRTPAPSGPSQQQLQAEQMEAAQQAAQQTRRGQGLIGGAIGAGGGAAIGAIAGNAGEGAAIGAVGGFLAGRIRRRREKEEAAKEAAQQEAQSQQASQAQVKSNWQAGLNSFRRAFSACLGARGYSAD